MSQSECAKHLQAKCGTRAAASYLKAAGFPFYLSHFILLGKWPK